MIRFSENNNDMYISAAGHITAQYCSELKKTIFGKLDSQNAESSAMVYVDLSECTYMDSTFIGALVGINKKLKKISGNKVHLQNIQPQCKDLLVFMGVFSLFDTDSPAVPFPDNLTECTAANTSAEDILDAHENLMELSDDNKKRFETLHDTLESQINQRREQEKPRDFS
ncbi:MAG: STAS domain-containing protein [Bacteroides sp.]|nr:STAS domain-containing protein [Prevotella sp.]MCM1408159.1 STAS domain-containing protein [Treponema brennaborense]MCM1469483.1 STAS domain-containing protein [Bacteroides sp.]